MNTYDKGLMWFRRDLRAEDNAALHHALKTCKQVWCVFVFDTDILDPLSRVDRRVEFIRESLVELDARLGSLAKAHGISGGGLIVRHARAQTEVPALAQQLQVQAVFANHDDEPDALARDAQVFGSLAHAGILMHSHKDHVIFERREVLTQAGHAFGVFTPYKNAWLKQLTPYHLKAYPVEKYGSSLALVPADLAAPVPSLASLGFEPSNLSQLPMPTGSSGALQLFEDFVQRIEGSPRFQCNK